MPSGHCMMRSYYRYRYSIMRVNDRAKLLHAFPSHPMLLLCMHRHIHHKLAAALQLPRQTTTAGHQQAAISSQHRLAMPVGSNISGRRQIPVSHQTHVCMGGRDVAQCAVYAEGHDDGGLGDTLYRYFRSMCCTGIPVIQSDDMPSRPFVLHPFPSPPLSGRSYAHLSPGPTAADDR